MECADLIASLEPASRQLASSDARCTGSDSRDQRQRQRDRPMKNYWRVAVVGHWCTPNACARSVPYLFRIHLACGCSDASATHKKKTEAEIVLDALLCSRFGSRGHLLLEAETSTWLVHYCAQAEYCVRKKSAGAESQMKRSVDSH